MRNIVLTTIMTVLVGCAPEADRALETPVPAIPKDDALPMSPFTSHEIKTTSGGYIVEAAATRQNSSIRSANGYVIEAAVQ
nr:hypothetical protein BdHM001_35640 [Bdellovibrio sp. HM001]